MKRQDLYTFEELSPEAQAVAFSCAEMHWWYAQDIEEAAQEVMWALEEVRDLTGARFVVSCEDPGVPWGASCDYSANFFEVVEAPRVMELSTYAGAADVGHIAQAYNDAMSAHDLDGLLARIEEAQEASERTPAGAHDWHVYDVLEMQGDYCTAHEEAMQAAARAATELLEAARLMYGDVDDARDLLDCFYFTADGGYVRAI